MDKKKRNIIIIASSITAFVVILGIVLTLVLVGGKKNINQYTINFYVEEEIVETRTVDEGAILTDIPVVPEKVGMTGSWDRIDFTNIKENGNVHAVYTVKVLDIKFYADSKLFETKTVNYGETLSDIPAVPEKTGCTNGRWDRTDFSNITADINVNALYDVITLEIAFYSDAEEQNLVDTKTVNWGATLVDIPDVPEVVGKDGAWDRTDFTNITANGKVHAVYTTKVLDVNFYVNDELYIAENVEYGEDLEYIPEVPERENYIGSWDVTDFTNITENIIVNAVYEAEVFTYEEYSDSITITGLVDKDAESVTIPATLKGKPVTEIARDAFSNGLDEYPNLVSITFAANSNVETIGYGAFYYSHIESITIPKSVTNLEEGALYCAKGLETVEFEEGSTIEAINKQTFYSCDKLTNITLPNTITIIDNEAFKGCDLLETITVPDGVIYIGNMAFNLCLNLESIILPSSLTIVGDSAFYYCNALTTVYYYGTANDWDYIAIQNNPTNNDQLVNATRYYYAENPTEMGDNFWHYVDDEIELWQLHAFEFYVDGVLNTTVIVDIDTHSIPMPRIPEKVGYTNGRWIVDEYNSTSVLIIANAEYDKVKLDVKFYTGNEDDGYTLSYTKQVDYGDTLTDIPAAPTELPYKGTWDVTDFSNITENVNVYAVTTTLNIKFYVGSTLIATKHVVWGNTLTDIPLVPTTEGYTGEWNRTDFTNLTTNIYVYAVKITLNVNFYVDGVLNTTRQVKYGYSLTDIPEVPVKVGKYGSWSVTDFTNIKANWTVNAVYKEIDFEYDIIDDEYVIIRTLRTHKWDITIPATIDGKPVKEIGNYAFSGLSLDSVTFAAGSHLETIGINAFANNSILSITIPSSVKTIGNSAFSGNSILTSLTFEADSQLETIGIGAFSLCTMLDNITIPKSVKTIGDFAFMYCMPLSNFTFEADSQLESIGEQVFCKCQLITSITIPRSVKTFSGTFKGCLNLQTIIFEEGSLVTEIGEDEFKNLKRLTSVILPNNLLTIGDGAFIESGITSITIPSSVTTLGYGTFRKSNLATITFEEGSNLSFIGDRAFADTKLTSITLPSGITTIGAEAFISCQKLETVVMSNNVRKIGNNAFCDCIKLANLTLSTGLTQIGGDAFHGCAFTTIVVPEGVLTLTCGVFWGCHNLTDVTLPSSITQILSAAFFNCSRLEELTFNGTREQWHNIHMESKVFYNLKDYIITIHCTDGDLSYSVSKGAWWI